MGADVACRVAATRLNRVATIFAGGTPDRTNPTFWTGGTIPWLNSGSVNDGVVSSPSELITPEAATGSSTRWAHAGSVLVALAGQGKTKAMAARLEISSTINQSMAAIAPLTNVLNYRYLQLWLSANYQSIRNLAGGDLRGGLNLQHIGAIQVPLPSVEEQSVIAQFLDRETAEIDAFIADQEELIGLLTERRAATISHAVTKGLDPSVPMKDSGVEWLGEVPAHWQVGAVRRLRPRCESGTSVNGYPFPIVDGEIGVLKTGSVSKGYFDPHENKRVLEEDLERVSAPVRQGSLLVNRANSPELVGAAALVRTDALNSYLSDKLWQLDFTSGCSAFLYYWTQSSYYLRRLLEPDGHLPNDVPATENR